MNIFNNEQSQLGYELGLKAGKSGKASLLTGNISTDKRWYVLLQAGSS